MAKRKDTVRTGWVRTANVQRNEAAQASGGNDRMQDIRSSSNTVRRIGPYETSYQVDFGYTVRRDV